MKQFGWRAAFVAAWLGVGASAGAQVTTHDPASVLVFPKVIVDASHDTAIQITNFANRPTYAVCYYVNGALTLPDQPPGPANPPLWTNADFTLALFRQQPTQWVASRGRSADPSDDPCRSPDDDCDGAGLDPGLIPPVPQPFTGELVCYETDASGAPWSGNGLIGHATLTALDSGEVVKYPAIGAIGFESNDADSTLCLGGEADERCPSGAEYTGCASEWIVSHPADFDERRTDLDASFTSVTIAPCTHDFDTQVPETITLQIQVITEFEQLFSASVTVTCWADVVLSELNAIFERDVLGSDWVATRFRSASAQPLGFTMVQQTERLMPRPPTIMIAGTVPHRGDEAGADVIVVPEETIP